MNRTHFVKVLLLLACCMGVGTAQVRINEIESNGGTPGDWVELINTGAAAVDVSGWKMLDNDNGHTPYVIPSGTSIPAAGYLVLEEEQFGFGLGAPDSVRIYDAATTPVTGTPYDTYSWTTHAATTYGLCPNGTGTFVTTSSSTKGAANDCSSPIRINEVESSGGVPGDWVELFNPSAAAVNVSGYKFLDNDDTHTPYLIPSGTSIAAGGYLVLEEAQFVFGLGSADSARLFDATGAPADAYSWTAHAATTYGRCPNGVGAFTTTTSSTKGSANDCGVSVKINEIESNNGVPGDWVELFNPGVSTADLSGFVLKDNDDTHIYAIPGGTTIAPGGYLVLEEAQFVFGLGAADSVRLFDVSSTLVDSYAWTAHATTTYGRCPNGTGDFTTTSVPTKGTMNACPGILSFLPWPGGSTIATVDGSNVFGGNLSGLIYEASGSTTPGVLWGVRNGPGSIFRLVFNDTIWTPDTTNSWGSGKLLTFSGGTGSPDSEGITFAGSSANGLYVSVERDNNVSSVSRNTVLRFDANAPGTTIQPTHEWNLTPDLPATGANLGAEAVVYLPDSYLTANGFFDESKNHAYNPSEYPNHGTGLFFVGLEANGNIYGYALDHSGNGAFTRVATIVTGLTGVMDLNLDKGLGDLWAVCDDTCQGHSVVLRVGPAGKFVVASAFERPSGMPNFNNEGFTTTALRDCVAGLRPVFWADDTEDGGHAIRQGSLSCSPIVTFPDTRAPIASPAASPTPNANGWNNTNVTVAWNWADNPGGAGIDAANCASSSISSGEGSLTVNATCKDLAGNSGSGSLAVKVDKTAPTVAITSPAVGSYSASGQLELDWSATDGLSGVAAVSAKLDGTNASKGQVVDLFFLPLGQHTLLVNAMDNAGNQGSSSVTFTVAATAGSMAEAIDRLLATGEIDNGGIANSLKAKLGKNANQMNAFLNELDAQRGKHVSEQAYGILHAQAVYVIAHP